MKRTRIIVFFLTVLICSGCFKLDEEAILTINPGAVISTHIKNQKLYATAQVNVNPDIVASGNLPILYEYEGELAIYNTRTGNIIDLSAFTGGGLSQVYTVSADTATHERFIIIASGTVNAFADNEKDGKDGNNSLLATGEFHTEVDIILENLFQDQDQ